MRARLTVFLALLGAVFACNDPTAVDNDITPGMFTMVAAGDDHACALDTLSRAWCWGSNFSGQTGVDPDDCVECSTRAHLVETELRFTAISAGGRHTCGIASDGLAYCWGDGAFGQLAAASSPSCRPDNTCTSTPSAVVGGFRFKSITAGGYGTCAITETDVGKCWGYQSFSSTLIHSAPATVSIGGSGDSTWQYLGRTDADFSGCGVTAAGVMACWGSNLYGQVGVGAVSSARVSPKAISLQASGKSVANGLLFACALTVDTEAFCWGRSANGSLGLGGDAPSATCLATTAAVCFPTPLKVAGVRRYSAIAVGESHVCGIDVETSEPYCWGNNTLNAIGAPQLIRPNEVAPSPLPAAPGFKVSALSAGSQFTCAMGDERNVYCWGSNTFGQLGVAGFDRGGIRSSAAPIVIKPQ